MNTVSFCPLAETSQIPQYAKEGDAGMDIFSNEDSFLNKDETKVISSGCRVKIPDGTVGFVCPRSGLAAKYSITVENAPGIIDSKFTGELKVILHNDGQHGYEIKKGDRIAQLVVVPFISCKIVLEKDFSKFDTERGENGFGSTGK